MICNARPITWAVYLPAEAVTRLVNRYSAEAPWSDCEDYYRWLATRLIRDQIRLDHFDWAYGAYTVHNPPTYCGWLPADEIRTQIMHLPVAPFQDDEFWQSLADLTRSENHARQVTLATLQSEQAFLKQNRKLWSKADEQAIQYYELLPYTDNADEDKRWIQFDY